MDPSRFSPIPFSASLVGGATEDGVATEPSSLAGSADGSYDGILSAYGSSSAVGDADLVFRQPEFSSEPLMGTVRAYDRHVFLCYKSPSVWPSHVVSPESDRLPRLLSAAVNARKSEMRRRTRLTICEGEDGTNSSNGDVYIFPDMLRYRQLTHFDVDNFVEEVLVKDGVWLPGGVEPLQGSFVFVCAHGSRECGACGPVLIKKFKEEIHFQGLQDQVFVSPCTHVGGHKYAGNVIIFRSSADGVVTGHWYGYVLLGDVQVLVEQHILRGEIVEGLWRGQMGLSEEDQKKSQELRLKLSAARDKDSSFSDPPSRLKVANGLVDSKISSEYDLVKSIFQKHSPRETGHGQGEIGADAFLGIRRSQTRRVCPMPSWYETWEREDTYAVLAVVAAAASVAFAFHSYWQLR